jgi:hypothetical protein
MAICSTGACHTLDATEGSVRILRSTFRRGDEAVFCELGLNGDESAYELRLNPPWNPSSVTTEVFDDAMSAFQRHAAIERLLVQEGWTLEGFESKQGRRDQSSRGVPGAPLADASPGGS